MSIPFDATSSFIPVSVELFGPTADTRVTLALDTGATRTWISREIVAALGYDLADFVGESRFISASGGGTAPIINIERITALEQERQDFPVLAHNLPPSAPFNGLLGLDFLRGQRLTIDFRAGLVTLD